MQGVISHHQPRGTIQKSHSATICWLMALRHFKQFAAVTKPPFMLFPQRGKGLDTSLHDDVGRNLRVSDGPFPRYKDWQQPCFGKLFSKATSRDKMRVERHLFSGQAADIASHRFSPAPAARVASHALCLQLDLLE